MNGDLGSAAGRVDSARLTLRLIVEATTESGVADVLGFDRHERGEGERAGRRNHRTSKAKTAERAVEYSAPQVRDRPEPFISGARAALSGRARKLADWRSNSTPAGCRPATSRRRSLTR